MKWADELPRWQKNLTAGIALLAMFGAAFVYIPTPFHMDVEAAEMQQQQQNADACAVVYQLEAQISEAEMQMMDPRVPEWYKLQLSRKLPVWRDTLQRLRAAYQCVEYAR